METENLATELLHEVKNSAKRWFIIALVEMALILLMGAGFVWYISLPTEDVSIEQEADHNGYNLINSGDGDLYNGKTKDNIQETGGTQ